MKTKLLLKNMNFNKDILLLLLFLSPFATFAQVLPNATVNTEITGATVESFFTEQVDLGAGKENYAVNMVDGDPDTDWAGESVDPRGEFNIINLNGTYDLTEIQVLTVAKLYLFEIWVSTNTAVVGDFVNAFPSDGNLVSNGLSTAYKTFDLASPISGVKYVMLKFYGRADSSWNTISEIKFFSPAAASITENELGGFSLYPSPANESLFIGNMNNKVSNVELLSLEGRVVLSTSINSFTKESSIDTSALSNGIYLVKLSDESGSLNASKMIVIQH